MPNRSSPSQPGIQWLGSPMAVGSCLGQAQSTPRIARMASWKTHENPPFSSMIFPATNLHLLQESSSHVWRIIPSTTIHQQENTITRGSTPLYPQRQHLRPWDPNQAFPQSSRAGLCHSILQGGRCLGTCFPGIFPEIYLKKRISTVPPMNIGTWRLRYIYIQYASMSTRSTNGESFGYDRIWMIRFLYMNIIEHPYKYHHNHPESHFLRKREWIWYESIHSIPRCLVKRHGVPRHFSFGPTFSSATACISCSQHLQKGRTRGQQDGPNRNSKVKTMVYVLLWFTMYMSYTFIYHDGIWVSGVFSDVSIDPRVKPWSMVPQHFPTTLQAAVLQIESLCWRK